MCELTIKDNPQNLPERKSDLFTPYFCYKHEDGTLRDFWRSRLQVAMCHDFDQNSPNIIEVDLRVDQTSLEPELFGVIDELGRIHAVYPSLAQVHCCGYKNRQIVPVEVVVLSDLQTYEQRTAPKLPTPTLTIEL